MTLRAESFLLEYVRVCFRYPNAGIALDDCSLAIRKGSRNALIGANGAGKTTLFQHANGLLQPQSGYIHYAGQPIDYSRSGLRRLRSEVGMVFQNPDQQLFSASVQEDVSFGPLNLGLDMDTVRQRVDAALRAVRMQEFADRPVHNLSFGQKKRGCIAGVLAMQPQLLVLDEPMAGLDQGMRLELLGVLEHLHGEGITLLLATHDIDFAYRWADQIHLLAKGRCTATLDAVELPNRTAELLAAGLPVPSVIEICRHLVACGTLPEDAAPRSSAELISLLSSDERTPMSPMSIPAPPRRTR